MSIIKKVIDAEREKRGYAPKQPRPRALGKATMDLLATSGGFESISTVTIDQELMEKNNILPALVDHGAVTAYKMMRTRVLQRMRSNGWQTLIVTSAGPGEGKTMTACNLAISISADVNQAVVLADLDLQRPSLASRLGLDAEVGISDYLLGHAELKDIVYKPTGMDRIAVIPNLRAVPHSSELLSAPRMRTLVEWLNSQGPETISIFDTPPVLACDDVLAFSPFADAILMVVAEGKAERISLSRSMELMADRNILGVVLNQTREKSSVSSYY